MVGYLLSYHVCHVLLVHGKENCDYTQLLGVYPSHVQTEHGIRVGEQVPNHSDKEARINQDVTHTMV